MGHVCIPVILLDYTINDLKSGRMGEPGKTDATVYKQQKSNPMAVVAPGPSLSEPL